EEIDGLSRCFPGKLPGELDPLCFPSRERGRALPELDVIEADRGESLELVPDDREVFEVGERLLDGHVKNLGDRLPLVLHLERLAVIPPAPAPFAFDVDVREEVHLDLDQPVPLAGLAAASLQVEREPSRLIATDL